MIREFLKESIVGYNNFVSKPGTNERSWHSIQLSEKNMIKKRSGIKGRNMKDTLDKNKDEGGLEKYKK